MGSQGGGWAADPKGSGFNLRYNPYMLPTDRAARFAASILPAQYRRKHAAPWHLLLNCGR